MKKEVLYKINILFWFIVAISIMVICYFTWIKYGLYTLFSFLASFLFHGGSCLLFYFICKECITKYYNK